MTAKRALTRIAATIAASAVPPASSTSASANCADPENTITEATMGATTPQPRSRASTPKDTAITKTAGAIAAPARSPALKLSGR